MPRCWPSQLGLGSGPVRASVHVYPVGYAGFVPGMRSANLHGAPWRDLLSPRQATPLPAPRRLLVARAAELAEAPSGPSSARSNWNGWSEPAEDVSGGTKGGERRPLSARQHLLAGQARHKLQRRIISADLYAA